METEKRTEIKKNLFEVSIIVLTYNSSWDKLLHTLESILLQENVKFQIIVADDASNKTYFENIKTYFQSRNFKHFVLVTNKVNQGTVLNTFKGLKYAEGKYVKEISPGDSLYATDTLRRWIDHMEGSKSAWSFSEAIYYKSNCKREIHPISVAAHPNDLTPYITKNNDRIRWNYVVLSDIALGATTLCITSLMRDYCKKIINKVIYAEDVIWKLMMFDGIVGSYYPEFTILYEYGSGISTSGDNEWLKRIKNDWKHANEIMLSEFQIMNPFQKAMKKATIINEGTSKWRKLLIRGKIHSYIKRHINGRKTVPFLP